MNRHGMAGLIIVVMVLGLMMSIAVSSSLLVRSESGGQGAKEGYKKAYFAAMSGVHFAVSRLRNDVIANTFSAGGASRIYFAFSAPDNPGAWGNTYKTIGGTSGWTNYAFTSSEVASETFSVSTTFAVNTDVKPSEYLFSLCSYPGADASKDYWIKSQGRYVDSETGNRYRAQVWAALEISNSLQTVSLKKFGRMTIQNRTKNGTAGVNDFWDWQDTFH